MAAAGAHIRGFAQLMGKLRRLEKNAAKRAVTKAVRAGTTVLLRAVKSATPVDEGQLKKAQASKIIGKGFHRGGVVGADVGKLEQDNAADASRPTNIDYLVEYGHTTPGGKIVPPSGYMRRAAAEAMPRAEAAAAERLRDEIEKEAAK